MYSYDIFMELLLLKYVEGPRFESPYCRVVWSFSDEKVEPHLPRGKALFMSIQKSTEIDERSEGRTHRAIKNIRDIPD